MSKFKVRCTKTRGSRFIKGKIYDVQDNGQLFDEYGRGGCFNTTESFKAWYKDCHWTDYSFELVSADRHELHITSDGITTNAVYKLNGKVEKQAKAVCCPSDTFNFNTGAELAINRVLYGTDYNPREVAFKEPMQNQPKEAVTLYCVKSWGSSIDKGKIYEFCNGQLNANSGSPLSSVKCETIEEMFVVHNYLKNCLIRAEKRQAKVGEWVVALHETDNVPKGSVKEVLSVNWFGSKSIRVMPDGEGGILPPSGYLVLPDYQPEKVEPTYWSGAVKCTDNRAYPQYTNGKIYAFNNGASVDDLGVKFPYTGNMKSFKEFCENTSAKFIEYRGEQSC